MTTVPTLFRVSGLITSINQFSLKPKRPRVILNAQSSFADSYYPPLGFIDCAAQQRRESSRRKTEMPRAQRKQEPKRPARKTSPKDRAVASRPSRRRPLPNTQETLKPQARPPESVDIGDAPPSGPPPPRQWPASDVGVLSEEAGATHVAHINSDLVTIPATVFDYDGKAVTDLKLGDFELWVDGQSKPISDLSRSEAPVRLALLFDGLPRGSSPTGDKPGPVICLSTRQTNALL